jgi:glycine/D-amino acid oxidase-like deaminating enzyme
LFLDLVHTQSAGLPRESDIVIIDSGITGTSIARLIIEELAAMDVRKRIAMLEVRDASSGATSRNGGHIKSSPYESFPHFQHCFGTKRARRTVAFERSHLFILVDLAIQEEFEIAEVREFETVDVFMEEGRWEES